MKRVLSKILSGIVAGILISIGGTICLALLGYDKVVGAILFTVALTTICYKGYALFTGKVGYIVESHTKDDFETLFLCLFGNLIGAVAFGYMIGFAMPSLSEVAYTACLARVENTILQALIKGILCGILMYVAVSVFRENNKNVLGIMLAIPTFILAGFEHSIADMFYFACGNLVSLDAFIFLVVVIIGNAVGGMLLPLLQKGIKALAPKQN